ncbi:MAG TPA: hypothetical protein VD963_05220 [Phycisphaerales bacterium]|nr:hypothetical protein [Phycisphaerales bacterium]
MSATLRRSTPAWEDKFRRPGAIELLAALPEPVTPVFTACRGQLTGLGLTEQLAWHGVPWRWSFVYTVPAAPAAWAYLVPDPQRPQVAAPIPTPLVGSLGIKRLKKHAREGLARGRVVAGTLWATWELTSGQQLDEVMELLSKRRRLESHPTSQAS